ncbi:thioesterase II family protein [Nocardia sp. NPDC057663]|uniref:thioesterase II family protein n=1 Tax=Nocardia sp. NPDC057663 TaxID=3346201 RepID=UPI0036728CFE
MTTDSTLAASWLPYPGLAEQTRVTLYCFPHAGSGASGFLGWRTGLPAEVAVVPVQPPGREMRWREAPYETVDELVEELLTVMSGRWHQPFALFGHSMGAIIAYEIARRLHAGGQPSPIHLFVSGRRAPQLPATEPLAHRAGDDEFVEVVRELGGTPEHVLTDETLRSNLFTLLRADFAVNETYRYRPGPPLDTAVTVFGGVEDPRVSRNELTAWQQCTTGPFELRLEPGGHFFVVSQRARVLGHIGRTLTGALR